MREMLTNVEYSTATCDTSHYHSIVVLGFYLHRYALVACEDSGTYEYRTLPEHIPVRSKELPIDVKGQLQWVSQVRVYGQLLNQNGGNPLKRTHPKMMSLVFR